MRRSRSRLRVGACFAIVVAGSGAFAGEGYVRPHRGGITGEYEDIVDRYRETIKAVWAPLNAFAIHLDDGALRVVKATARPAFQEMNRVDQVDS